MASGPRGEAAIFLLLAMAGLALLTLALAAWLGARSRRPSPRKPPRKTFEHGRRLARLRHVETTDAACAALKSAPVGQLVDARAGDARADVVVRRRRSQPCVQAAGYVAGLFESAWAHEVLVTHPSCAGARGGDCVYVVQRAPTASGAPTAAASTPGSAAAPHRSTRARAGGG